MIKFNYSKEFNTLAPNITNYGFSANVAEALQHFSNPNNLDQMEDLINKLNLIRNNKIIEGCVLAGNGDTAEIFFNPKDPSFIYGRTYYEDVIDKTEFNILYSTIEEWIKRIKKL